MVVPVNLRLINRYLEIGLIPVLLVWFVSGIAMMYAPGMPGLTPGVRLAHLPALDMARVGMTPAEAAARADFDTDPEQVTLLMVMDRPAYRFAGPESATIFADTGDRLLELGPAGAVKIAASFLNLPLEAFHHTGMLNEPDQWTIGQRDQMPLHRIEVDDQAHTELYVSGKIAEPVVLTTRRSRGLAWISAIPHRFYFSPLVSKDAWWTTFVLVISGLAVMVVLGGIRRSGFPGLVFRLLTLTWLLSGMLSMQPQEWTSGGGLGDGVPAALSGGSLKLAAFPAIDSGAWKQTFADRAPKEITFLRVQGDPYYLVNGVESRPLLVRAGHSGTDENLFHLAEETRLEIRREPFSVESLTGRVQQAVPDMPVLESRLLSTYDSYYCSNDGSRPLPVLRIKLGDPDRTWFYIDPELGGVVARYTRLGRIERWIFPGLHRLDFSFWYCNRALWEFAIIVLSVGCMWSLGREWLKRL
jgi:hypothetical protein